MKKMSLIALIVILPVILVCTTWTVKQDQTGDYETIGDALASQSVVNGDEIVVYEGTYYENVVIDKNIYLRGRGENHTSTTIVDGSQNPTNTVITMDDDLSEVVIQWLTIQSNTTASGIGIYIRNDDVLITECVIRNIRDGIHVQGWNTPYRTPVIKSNKIYSNNIGIYCNSPIMPLIEDNDIYSNSDSGLHFYGDFWVPELTVTIIENRIYNHLNQNAKAIFSQNVDLILESNIIFDNYFAFCHGNETSHSLHLVRSTIYNNNYFMNEQYNTLHVINTIIWDNEEFLYNPPPLPPPYPPYMPYTINYSCIQETEIHYIGGEGVITQDPLFNDPQSFNLTLEWSSAAKSPCIDTGDPNSPLDPDGTRADMGALYLDHLEKEYAFEGPDGPHDGWTWLCFDILDIYDPEETNQVQNFFETIQEDLEYGDHEGLIFFYDPIQYVWQNGEELITSPKGYKIIMTAAGSINVSGFRCKETTTFDIYADAPVGNWIGYFRGRTQHVYDSFNGYLDNIYFIQHQEWSIDGSRGWPDVNYTLSPGDMVIVYCNEDIIDFCWVADLETERFLIEDPQMFTFNEEADYLPIYVELDENDLPDEIAIFVDDECKGARVVQHTFENICAYVTELQSGSVEIEFAYYGREANKRYSKYTIIDPVTGKHVNSSIDLSNRNRMYHISFRSEEENSSDLPVGFSASNYPNPFNPSTVISYDLPQESRVGISIYNLRGQKVKELISGIQPAGYFSAEWNGKDESGKNVASGIYYYRIEACGKTLQKKMLLLK